MNVKNNPVEDTVEILIAEDSPTQAEQLKHLLEQHHYRVTVAGNGKQALALLAEHQPALVISDILMPEMNGYELCQRIKAEESTQDIPVILLTSLSNFEDVLDGLACGADYFVTKPYDEDYLFSNIEMILANRKLRDVQRARVGVEIVFAGESRFIAADQRQMLTLLLSTYEAAVRRNTELARARDELRLLNERLESLVEERTAALSTEITERKRAEEALKQSEERYRAIASSAVDAIVTADDAGVVTGWNQGAERIFGFAEREILGHPLTILMPESYHDRHAAGLSHHQEGGESRLIGRTVELDGKRKDGSKFPLELSLARWETTAGRFVTGIARDITERKQAEGRERLAREVLDLLNRPESATDTIHAILRLVKNSTGFEAIGIRLREGDDFPYYETEGFSEEFVLAERSLCAYDKAGKLIRDAVGNPVLECMCGNVLCGRTDATLPFFTENGSFWTNNTTKLLASTTEKERQGRTRNRCNGEGYESVALIPLRSGGEIVGLLQFNDCRPGRFTPETVRFLESLGASIGVALVRKKMEEKIQDLARFPSEDPNPVLRITRDGTLLYINEAGLRLLPEWHLQAGQTVPSFLRDDALQVIDSASAAVIDVEHGERVYSFSVAPQAASDYANYYGRDITDRRQAEAARVAMERQLFQAQKMEAVGRLAGGVAHDFNNLLMVISGYSELLLESAGADTKTGHAAEQIKHAADRAASLTRQLLAFSRQQPLLPRVLNLNEVLSDLEKMLRRVIGEDVDLLTVLDPNLANVKADPGQIDQIMMNLAVNARDAMPNGGKLTIETSNVEIDDVYASQHGEVVRTGPYVLLAVSDTGCGMDAETQSHIFEPFFTTKEKGKGTGLGLATVYGIVKQSSGLIRVYSEPGRGTTFTIYLPRVTDAAEGKERPARVSRSTGSETVLLVEDDATVRALVGQMLRGHGYTVLEAGDGVEAFEVCERHPHPIHLLMTDTVMPKMGGPELARRLIEKRPEMKVLFMSGYTDQAILHQQVLEHGAAFVQKPFSAETLTQKLRELLAGDGAGAATPRGDEVLRAATQSPAALLAEDNPANSASDAPGQQ